MLLLVIVIFIVFFAGAAGAIRSHGCPRGFCFQQSGRQIASRLRRGVGRGGQPSGGGQQEGEAHAHRFFLSEKSQKAFVPSTVQGGKGFVWVALGRSVFSTAMHEPPDTPADDALLIDFGAGRRLEKLGGILVDRPLPQARLPKKLPALWAAASVRYSVLASRETRWANRERGRVSGAHGAGQERGQWEFSGPLPDPWQIELPLHPDRLLLEVRPAPSGQTGLFLEQLGQWQWLRRVTPQGAPAFITNVSVRGEHRGRGLGGRLLGAALDHGRGCGFTHVALEVDAGATAARQLYRKHGFVQQEARGATLLMQRRL
jgi:GNAT superfamily N-acetyltransferase